MRRSRIGCATALTPNTLTVPVAGLSSAVIMRIVVVLPATLHILCRLTSGNQAGDRERGVCAVCRSSARYGVGELWLAAGSSQGLLRITARTGVRHTGQSP
jgi:hypothetical protein